MAGKKSARGASTELAPRGDAVGLATIRMWTAAIETAMIKRYIGNAPTLKALQKIVHGTIRQIDKIKPAALSDCPDYLMHEPACYCSDPSI